MSGPSNAGGGTGGLVAGADYWVDPVTAGKLTATAPATAGQFQWKIGTALDTLTMLVNPGPTLFAV